MTDKIIGESHGWSRGVEPRKAEKDGKAMAEEKSAICAGQKRLLKSKGTGEGRRDHLRT